MKVPLTVGDFLDRGASVFPDRIAVVDEPDALGSLGSITYQELATKARSLAGYLEEHGVGIGERVAIASPNAAKFLVALFGVSAYGRTLVPINYRLTGDDIAYILEHSGSSVLLIDPEVAAPHIPGNVKRTIVLDGVQDAELFTNDLEPSRWEDPDEDAPASVNYTSGTTARPKGVQMTHRNCWLNATTLGWHTAISDRDCYLHTLPMFHCNGWGLPYAVTGMGCQQVVQRKIDGEEILRRIESHGVTMLSGAPAVVASILDAATVRAHSGAAIPGAGTMRILVAGAPPPSRVIERVESELQWEFMQLYGLTETAPLVTFNRAPAEWDDLTLEKRARLLAQAGPPGLGVRVKIAEDGEILTRSNNVFAGYWEQPVETDKALRDGWFHTGDGGELDGARVVVSDRKKDVIISGGENVSSIEVEDCLYQHPGVAEVCVIGVPDAKWGETVKALVVARDGAAITEEEVIAFARERLAHFKCPTSVEFRDAFERTATGKLQKFKIRAPYWQDMDRQVN